MKTGTSKEDRRIFEELFRHQADRLHRMSFLLLHDPMAAEDAVQETWVRGVAKFHAFRQESRPDVWLYSVALNVCRQHLRNAKVRERLAEHDQLDRGRHPGRGERGPLTTLMRRETALCLAIALGFLTDLQREAFVLHYMEELPYEAVAPMLGVSLVACRGLAHRARKTLIAKLPPNISRPFGS